MWIVTCDYVKGELTYFVENRETGERKGQFGCEPWAQEMADELNREERYDRTGLLERGTEGPRVN